MFLVPKRQKHLHICSLWWLFVFINCQVSFIFGRSKLTSRFSKRPPSTSSVYAELSQSKMYIVFSRLLLTELCFKNVWKTWKNQHKFPSLQYNWLNLNISLLWKFELDMCLLCFNQSLEWNIRKARCQNSTGFFFSLSLFKWTLLLAYTVTP